MRPSLLAMVTMIVIWCAPQGQAQVAPGTRGTTRPRLVLRPLNVGLTIPPDPIRLGDPIYPPGPCVVFDTAFESVTGREARPFHAGIVSVDARLDDDATRFTRGTSETVGRRGEAFLAGLLAGQPGDLEPCIKVGVILTNARTGEVLDRPSYDVDAAPTR